MYADPLSVLHPLTAFWPSFYTAMHLPFLVKAGVEAFSKRRTSGCWVHFCKGWSLDLVLVGVWGASMAKRQTCGHAGTFLSSRRFGSP